MWELYIRSFSTSNHNSATYYGAEPSVVYPFFSTSNHNFLCEVDDKPELYIRSFLHQTTTRQVRWNDRQRCISVLFYIKPQPSGRLTPASISCISVLFYIKPQLVISSDDKPASCISVLFLHQTTTIKVVSILSQRLYIRSFSTSNHNFVNQHAFAKGLYIRSFLHQTTTRRSGLSPKLRCISVLFLHQTTTLRVVFTPAPLLYIRSFLHQTTT